MDKLISKKQKDISRITISNEDFIFNSEKLYKELEEKDWNIATNKKSVA
jgi:hypothetical protein